jgi:hypothetical protein
LDGSIGDLDLLWGASPSIYLPLGEDLSIGENFNGTELALAEGPHWDAFMNDGWYEGVLPPPLPGTTNLLQVNNEQQAPLGPAQHPGILTEQHSFTYLPSVKR